MSPLCSPTRLWHAGWSWPRCCRPWVAQSLWSALAVGADAIYRHLGLWGALMALHSCDAQARHAGAHSVSTACNPRMHAVCSAINRFHVLPASSRQLLGLMLLFSIRWTAKVMHAVLAARGSRCVGVVVNACSFSTYLHTPPPPDASPVTSAEDGRLQPHEAQRLPVCNSAKAAGAQVSLLLLLLCRAASRRTD